MKLKSLLTETVNVSYVKNYLTTMGIEADSNPTFAEFLKVLVGKDSLNKLDSVEISKVYTALLDGKFDPKKSKTFFEPVELNAPYQSYQPFIDSVTMQVHYEGHYMGYLNKLNLELGTLDKKPEKKIEDLISNISKYSTTIKNNAGGYYNHNLFWSFITPNPAEPSEKLMELIKDNFKSLDEFKNKFEEKALAHFGSGWCWLVKDKNELKIVSTKNQDNPRMNDKNLEILIGLDLWEHAYYLSYKNKRDEYVKNFWTVACWCHANKTLG